MAALRSLTDDDLTGRPAMTGAVVAHGLTPNSRSGRPVRPWDEDDERDLRDRAREARLQQMEDEQRPSGYATDDSESPFEWRNG